MANKIITTSPDITTLGFSVLYDISTATPSITLTNQSVGPHLDLCTWWVQILSPSNTPIHQGSQGTPDETGNWTTFTPSDPWPQPYNQIEYSSVNPYSVTLFVSDSVGNIFSLTKTAIICRPNGNTDKTLGNFGTADFSIIFQWQAAQLYVQDDTNYFYEQQPGNIVSRTWVLDYPRDQNNNLPAPITITGTPNALFPLGVTGEGYNLYLSTIMLYTVGEDGTIKICYKKSDSFPVWYGLDMCSLMCEIDKFYASANMTESEILNPLAQQKLLRLNTLLQKCWMGILQPLCNIDVPAVVKEIEELGCFKCNWVKGINGSNPAGLINILKGTMCGDINMTIHKVGNNYTIDLSDVTYILAMGTNPGTAFSWTPSTNGCQKTYTLNVDINALRTALGVGTQVLPVYIHATTSAPTNCPNGYFPANVWNVADSAIIGVARTADDLVGILNADSGSGGWATKAVAFDIGNCKVGFFPITGQTLPSAVHVDLNVTSTTPCTNNTKTYDVPVLSYCDKTTKISMFWPLNTYVSYDNGTTIYSAGLAVNYTDLISKLQAESHKPSNITFSAVASPIPDGVDVTIFDANCVANNTVILYSDQDTRITFSANASESATNAEELTVVRPGNMTKIGKVCTFPGVNYPWQTVKIRPNLIMTVETNTGKLYFYDITNPLFPVISNIITLPTVPDVGSPPNVPFSGLPKYSGTVFSHWDVYTPTDTANVVNTAVYISESASGVIWRVDFGTLTITSFYDVRIVGMCPRYINPLTGKLYFTWDGDRNSLIGGLNSTNPRDILILDLSNFASAGLSTVQVAPASDSPWAASYDSKTGFLWISTQKGTLIKYDMSTDTVDTTYVNAWDPAGGAFLSLLNTNFIYPPSGYQYLMASSYGLGTYALNFTFSYTSPGRLDPMTPANVLHHNIIYDPGSCYMLVAFNANGSVNGGLAKYTVDTDFSFVEVVNVNGGDYFNAVVVDDVPSNTPNGLC